MAASSAETNSSAEPRAEFSDTKEEVLVVNKEELLACSLPFWYEDFKEHTFKSILIPLPVAFVKYLLSDGLVLPKGCELPGYSMATVSEDDWEEEDGSKGLNNSDDDDESEGLNINEEPSFPELVLRISQAIQTLNGNVFPKLNWSSPKDAKWIAPGNTLRCTCSGEIILLLKSSQFIMHDLTVMAEHTKEDKDTGSDTTTGSGNIDTMTGGDIDTGSDIHTGSDDVSKDQYQAHNNRGHTPQCTINEFHHTLCLRKWESLKQSCEFRCFVWDHKLKAISQRYCDNYFSYLSQDRDRIIHDLVLFQSKNVARKFSLSNYVMDVYRPDDGVVMIVDFNPFCPITDGLLFSWTELNEINDEGKGPVLRIVSDPVGIRPSGVNTAGLPKDIIDLSSGSDVNKLVDLMKERQYYQEQEKMNKTLV